MVFLSFRLTAGPYLLAEWLYQQFVFVIMFFVVYTVFK